MFSEFSDCIKWWNNREENEFAWFVKSDTFDKNNYDFFTIKNPNAKKDVDDRNISEIYSTMVSASDNIAQLLKDIANIIGE